MPIGVHPRGANVVCYKAGEFRLISVPNSFLVGSKYYLPISFACLEVFRRIVPNRPSFFRYKKLLAILPNSVFWNPIPRLPDRAYPPNRASFPDQSDTFLGMIAFANRLTLPFIPALSKVCEPSGDQSPRAEWDNESRRSGGSELPPHRD